MNSLDIMALAIIGIVMVQALTKGLAAELAEIACAIAGLFCALLFFENIEKLLLKTGVGNPMAAMLGFTSIFLVFIVLGALVSLRIKKALGKKGLTWRDRFWGVPLGLIRGFLINSVIFMVLLVFPVNPPLIRTSVTAPFFLSGIKIVKLVAPQNFRNLIPDEKGFYRKRPSGREQGPSNQEKDEGGVPDENTIEKI